MKLLQLMWKNALRNQRRTMLTILSIAVSMFLVGTLQAVLTAIYRTGDSSSTPHLRVIVHRSTSITQSLPESYRSRIASVEGVKYVVGVTWFGGQYIDASNFFANFAADTENFQQTFDDYVIPPGQFATYKNERTAALVGKKLMEAYHWHLGQRITLKSTIYQINPEFIIRAVYTDPGDPSQERSFYFHYDYFDELMGRPGQVGSFTVKVDKAGDVPLVIKRIDDTFRNTAAETKTETEQAFLLGFVQLLGNVRLLLTAISAAVVFTILLVSGNTMAMTIRERTAEVAVLKTLGFRQNVILFLLIGESLVIALLGGLAGGLGAKLAYAFIGLTFNNVKFLGAVFAAGAGAMAAFGAWSLFSNPEEAPAWVRGLRIAAAAAGGLIGFGLGFVFYMGVGFTLNQGGFLSGFNLDFSNLLLCLGIAAAVGIISAAFPALRASRVRIAEALRFVG
jgi:putative ABC transport system permease protein